MLKVYYSVHTTNDRDSYITAVSINIPVHARRLKHTRTPPTPALVNNELHHLASQSFPDHILTKIMPDALYLTEKDHLRR